MTSDIIDTLSFFINMSGIQVSSCLWDISNASVSVGLLKLARRWSFHLCLMYMFTVKSWNDNKYRYYNKYTITNNNNKMSINEALLMIWNEICSRINYISQAYETWNWSVREQTVIFPGLRKFCIAQQFPSLKYQQPTLCYSLTEQWSSLLETPNNRVSLPILFWYGVKP